MTLEKQNICPICQEETKITQTKYGPRESCETCQLVGWNGKELIDEKTRKARLKFHATFDPIWQEGFLNREEAYQLLANQMNMEEEKVHGSVMTKELCKKATEFSERIYQNFINQKNY